MRIQISNIDQKTENKVFHNIDAPLSNTILHQFSIRVNPNLAVSNLCKCDGKLYWSQLFPLLKSNSSKHYWIWLYSLKTLKINPGFFELLTVYEDWVYRHWKTKQKNSLQYIGVYSIFALIVWLCFEKSENIRSRSCPGLLWFSAAIP